MFTGIVQALCPVTERVDAPNLMRLCIGLGPLTEGLIPGASVAVNGVCLTATRVDAASAWFDVIEETIALSNLGQVRPGSSVNVERSMRAGDEVGGHAVTGHVVDTVTVERIDAEENRRVLSFRVADRWLPFLLYKGFVALDGASLTISAVDPDAKEFAVSLIPETGARTTLGTVDVGDRVNLEPDGQVQAVVSTVTRLLEDPQWRARLGAVTED